MISLRTAIHVPGEEVVDQFEMGVRKESRGLTETTGLAEHDPLSTRHQKRIIFSLTPGVPLNMRALWVRHVCPPLMSIGSFRQWSADGFFDLFWPAP
jgi:hypothetical protein